MKIKIYSNVGNHLLNNLAVVSIENGGAIWEDVYQAIYELKSKFPQEAFNHAPFKYVNFEDKTTGFIFVSEVSDDIFYVFK